jgi:hypothetical protein
VFFVFLVYAIAFGAICHGVARSRDRDPSAWAVLGFLGGALALLALLVLPPAGTDCPACGERVRATARRCRHCGETLTPQETAKTKSEILVGRDADAAYYAAARKKRE